MRSFTGNRIAGERDGLKAGHRRIPASKFFLNRDLGPPERDMARVDDDLRADLGRRRVTRDIGKPARATGASAYFELRHLVEPIAEAGDLAVQRPNFGREPADGRVQSLNNRQQDGHIGPHVRAFGAQMGEVREDSGLLLGEKLQGHGIGHWGLTPRRP